MFDLFVGDSAGVVATMADSSIDCIVTSPPYYDLRDYGHADQIGLEARPAEYIDRLVAVFRGCRRVLADHGSLWLNIGDTYASKWSTRRKNAIGNGSMADASRGFRPNRLVDGLKEKDLIGIPWALAFALRADGWFLRADLIWNKRSGVPDPAPDRPARSHEYVFLFSKKYRYYHAKAPGGSVLDIKPRGNGSGHSAVMAQALAEYCIERGCVPGGVVLDPFVGSGTVGAAALAAGRSFRGIDINPAYIELTRARLSAVQPSLL